MTEKTLFSFKTTGVRLQCVIKEGLPFPTYEVRKNRLLIFRTTDKVNALKHFRLYCFDELECLKLAFDNG